MSGEAPRRTRSGSRCATGDTPGSRTLTATDVAVPTITGSAAIMVNVRPGIVVTTYRYQIVKDTSLQALMEWVRRATEIPGMEVTELKLKAEPTDWNVDVTFRRWERAG